MAKDIIDNNGSITLQNESTESVNTRTAYKNTKAAVKYKVDRTAGFYDESTNQNTKTIYGQISDQLDMLYKDIESGKFGDTAKTGAWYLHIKSVKDNNPKG
jgi:hypothetical protein